MAKLSRNFIAGRMNKIVDERLLPDGEYIDAMNIRMGDTEKSEVGVIENTKGNVPLTSLSVDGVQLSINARCIRAVEDSANETLYWFVHDNAFPAGNTGVCDLIVSYNVLNNILTYHVISIDDGSGIKSTLNFNNANLITGVNIIGDFLFFTDNFNQPRFINTQRNYLNPVSFIDQITAEELLVIKKPPIASPTVEPINTGSEDNYMDTRFISFAYRYRYIDGEYSATSQWSQIAFVPKSFQFGVDSMLNEGMTNYFNSARITYNSGSNLVVGIDLLFKQSANNIIKVIEKLDKEILGISDNANYTYVFSSSKIFTVLSESELLRLYDNVPRLAQAQTIMGNRLMYGNYVEGYDLIDKDGNNVILEYNTNLISNPIGITNLSESYSSGNYTIDVPVTSPNSIVYIDLSNESLIQGSTINIQISIDHYGWSGDTPYPDAQSDIVTIDFSFYLTRNYTSVYQLATSPEFTQAIGTSLPLGNIKPVYSAIPTQTSCDGSTLTDLLNCFLPNTLADPSFTVTKIASGISFEGQAIEIIATPSSGLIGFQVISMKYVDNVTNPTKNYYEYYSIVNTVATFQKIASPQSLHSNRGYEIGMVYMDEYNRASTALVSPFNTEYVPCEYSANQNQIQVIIPPTQVAPWWAKRYKFVIKPDAEFYETIYSSLFFKDASVGASWFYLEGENATKVETGDRLIVKSDASGPVGSCIYATVLEKSAKSKNFITPPTGVGIIPAGVYIRINANSFNTELDPLAFLDFGTKKVEAYPVEGSGIHSCTDMTYNMSIYNPGWDPLNPGYDYQDYTVPAGSLISFSWEWYREGTGTSCEERGYTLKKTYTASKNYENILQWFIGDNIATTFNSGTSLDGSTYIQYLLTWNSTCSLDAMYVLITRDLSNNQIYFKYSTGFSCGGAWWQQKRAYQLTVHNTVYRALNNVIFETEPSEASPDVFFENNLSFPINEYGNHLSNGEPGDISQNIALNISAQIQTGFFNCFSFGNGVESYKIRDSIIGKHFTLGERVTTVSAQDYKEASRFADITYSGIYNAETNVNKLNEFNLGLLNYKNLETSFGPIMIIDGRETDVLALQEDKISYVLAGKNLLSDSAAGGAITSVPEVLGTQIARVEKYGISFNPESYVQWGYDRFFTDVKRGAVINIKGDSMQQDKLIVVSEANMRTWFRDEFNVSFNTQKLGAYDPYMNEYILSTNDILLPVDTKCLNCGTTQTFNFSKNPVTSSEIYNYCANFTNIVGDVVITWNVEYISNNDFTVNVTYDGTVYTSGPTSVSGSLTFPKNKINIQNADIDIEYTAENLKLNVNIDCPIAEGITIVRVVLTNNSEEGQTNHPQYRYQYNTFVGPIISIPVTFLSSSNLPVVSFYDVNTGILGNGAFPPAGSTLTIQSNQAGSDNFVFNPTTNKFKYLRTNVLYPNNPASIQLMLLEATDATPIIGNNYVYSSSFVVPSNTLGQYLYLIWDYRDVYPVELCYSDTINSKIEICCDCKACTTTCVTIRLTNLSDRNSAEVYFPNGDGLCGGVPGPLSVELTPEEVKDICVNNQFTGDGLWSVVDGRASVEIIACDCGL